jgi:hypothetical protein
MFACVFDFCLSVSASHGTVFLFCSLRDKHASMEQQDFKPRNEKLHRLSQEEEQPSHSHKLQQELMNPAMVPCCLCVVVLFCSRIVGFAIQCMFLKPLFSMMFSQALSTGHLGQLHKNTLLSSMEFSLPCSAQHTPEYFAFSCFRASFPHYS